MKDLAIALDHRPGGLADMGEALGRAGVSVEGGGAWVVSAEGIAHSLFKDGTAFRRALEPAGIRVIAERDVLVQRLRQDVPGQLGLLSCRMADAGTPGSTSKCCTATTIIRRIEIGVSRIS